MSSNAKIVLRKKGNKEGEFPLAIRITKNRRSNYHYIGHYINEKFWDIKNSRVKNSHPNSLKLNKLLLSELTLANQTLIDLQSQKKDLSANQIKNEIYSSNLNTSFFEVAKEYLHEMQSNNKLARLSSDKSRVKHVLDFSKSKQLTFQEIDEIFIKKFVSYLKKRPMSERSIVNTLIVVRTIFNRAIKSNIVDSKLYPFGAKKIRIKFPETEKIGLTTFEVKNLENEGNLNSNQRHALNVWLFSFYFAGIRAADVLKIRWNDIYDGRLHYRMNKNSKLLSLAIPEKAMVILNDYIDDRQNENDFIFPEMKKADLDNPKDVYTKTKTATKKLNKYLEQVAEKAGISKKLSMHIARHSFGNISEDKIPVTMLQKLYRHSSITTTVNYQSNFTHKDVDVALNSVVNF